MNVISTGVGGITESDVSLAKASSAIVIGFTLNLLNDASTIYSAKNAPQGVVIQNAATILTKIEPVKGAAPNRPPPRAFN